MLRTLSLVLALSGCSYEVTTVRGTYLADCYNGTVISFCVVEVPPGSQLVGSASGLLPSIGAATLVPTLAIRH
jgi:hypothetical protein